MAGVNVDLQEPSDVTFLETLLTSPDIFSVVPNMDMGYLNNVDVTSGVQMSVLTPAASFDNLDNYEPYSPNVGNVGSGEEVDNTQIAKCMDCQEHSPELYNGLCFQCSNLRKFLSKEPCHHCFGISYWRYREAGFKWYCGNCEQAPANAIWHRL
jgi:hypothetical protein